MLPPPLSLLRAPDKVCSINIMIKIIAGIGLIGFIALGLWLRVARRPQRLDHLDRLWGSSAGRRIAADIAYGDHRRQRLDFYAPKAADAAQGSVPKPLLIFFYGGSWNSGDKCDYAFAAKAYAERGFIVALPDYRLVPEIRFPVFLEDAAAAVAKARAEAPTYGADPDHILLAGHSAGAHIALMLALDPQWLERAGVPAEAIKGVVALSAPADFHPFTMPAAIAAMGHVEPPDLTQPVRFARAAAPPLWVATGTNDTLVHARNSRAMVAAQQAVGGVATLREYERLNHVEPLMAIARTFRKKAPVLDESVAFLKGLA